MRQILAGSVLVFASLSAPAIAQDPVPMQPAAIPEVGELKPLEAPLPDFPDLYRDAAARCVADFQLPYICCADDATLGARSAEDRNALRLAREQYCTADGREYPVVIAPPGGVVTGPGVKPAGTPDTPVEPVETESDAFGASERPD